MRPIIKLSALFVSVKCVLISLLFLVQKQYDTSSALIFPPVDAENLSVFWSAMKHALERLTIWDAVFYVSMAERGLQYEQEWAWGRIWSKLIEFVGDMCYPSSWPLSTTHWYAFVSVALAVTSHYWAMIILYKLTKLIFKRPQMANGAAVLYAISPAGMFLISGYSESTFALLSFLGLYFREKKLYIFSGIAFAIGCGIRGNGVLWGLVLLHDMFAEIRDKNWKRTLSTIIGGSIMGFMVISLQLYPYLLYCPERGEWCNNRFPSIFTFVQAHYWNVGLFNYWTPNNIPNFLFGSPTLVILFFSAKRYLITDPVTRIRPYIAVQLIIMISAVFVYHVQIITRIATCLPAMYWFGAELLCSTNLQDFKKGRYIVIYSVCWTIAQGILFSAFLPPA